MNRLFAGSNLEVSHVANPNRILRTGGNDIAVLVVKGFVLFASDRIAAWWRG